MAEEAIGMAGLSDETSEAELDRLVGLMETPRRWPPLPRAAGGIRVIDLWILDFPPDVPPRRRVLTMVLQRALKDRAREVHLEPWRFEEDGGEARPGLRMFYVVSKEPEELVPAPDFLAASLVRDVEAIAGLNAPRHRLAGLLRRWACRIDGQPPAPRQGSFLLSISEERVGVEVTAYPSDLGDRVFLRLGPISESSSEWIALQMTLLFMKARESFQTSSNPDPPGWRFPCGGRLR